MHLKATGNNREVTEARPGGREDGGFGGQPTARFAFSMSLQTTAISVCPSFPPRM